MWITVLNSADCSRYELHQKLWGLFPQHQAGKSDRPFCYKDTGETVYVLSNTETSESVSVDIEQGERYMFTVTASARRGTYRDESGKRVKLNPYTTASELKQWLARRLAGCAELGLIDVTVLPPRTVTKPNGNKMVFPKTEFKGVLTITDVDEFKRVASVGIGQGGAFRLGAILLIGDAL